MNIDFTTKEQVIFFMMTTSISLSHYDYKFISNMQSLTHDKKQITSGQADLFDKLLHKYRKQFATNGYKSNDLVKLPWKCVVVESLPKYTNANVDYNKEIDKLIIKVPFKKDFISAFRKEMSNYTMTEIDNSKSWVWQSEQKRYEANPTTYALKLAYDVLPKFFTTVYHNEVKDIITELESTEVTYRDPTLIVEDGVYTVVNSNNVLDELLLNVTLNNTPECLYLMSQLSIKVDEAITQGNPELLFASSYIVECDIDEMDDWMNWLTNLKVKNILLGRGSPSTSLNRSQGGVKGADIFIECRDGFKRNNFNMHMQRDLLDEERSEIDSLPILVQFNSILEPETCHGDNRNGKIIIITNRRTVNIT